MERTVGSPGIRALALVLRELREEAGLSQRELAASLDVPQQIVSDFELAARRLDLIQAREYAAALGTTLPDLVARFEAVMKAGPPASVDEIRGRQRRRDAQRD